MTGEEVTPAGDLRLQLTVPGRDAYLEVVRAVVGRAARLSGFTFNGIEDFVLAVDEAAVLLLSTRPCSVELTVEWVGEGLEAMVLVQRPEDRWPPEGVAEHTGWQVLHALCERVWLAEPHPGIGLYQGLR